MTIVRNQTRTPALWMALVVSCLNLGGCSESPEAPAEHARQHQGDHGEHEAEGHAEDALVSLTAAEIDEFGIELRRAGSGTIASTRVLPGAVTLNPNRVAHVTPLVPGVAQEVRATVGERVAAGEVLAVLVSRELAQAKSACLSARSRLELARATFRRAEDLWRQKITAEADYLAAREALEQARVEARLAQRALYTLGLTEKQVDNLSGQSTEQLARYELAAPIAGEVIAGHLTKGEVLQEHPAEPPFVVADLSTVWVQLTVYPKDLATIQQGQEVIITAGDGRLEAEGTISYVSPIIGEDTRTATARVVLENPQGRWKPGLFVSSQVRTGSQAVDVVVPASALQTMEGQTVVFVQTPQGFEPRPVKVGPSSDEGVQIVSGLQPGQTYAAANAFVLKAELLKGTFGGHHH